MATGPAEVLELWHLDIQTFQTESYETTSSDRCIATDGAVSGVEITCYLVRTTPCVLRSQSNGGGNEYEHSKVEGKYDDPSFTDSDLHPVVHPSRCTALNLDDL